MHSAARYYDLLAAFLTLGRERAVRERFVDLAGLAPGESVLDVGCGTGSLAVAAKRRVGPGGSVRGLDASREMIEAARLKAARAGLSIDFEVARAEALPLPDSSVDAVLSTLMLHHLPAPIREAFAHEIRRVLKPGGRVLAVDFERPVNRRGGLLARFHRYGGTPLAKIVNLLERAGLRVADLGAVGVSDLHFVVASAPDAAGRATPPAAAIVRTLPPLPLPRWILPVALLAVLGLAHLLLLRAAFTVFAFGTLAALALIALLALSHAAVAGGVYTWFRRRRKARQRG